MEVDLAPVRAKEAKAKKLTLRWGEQVSREKALHLLSAERNMLERHYISDTEEFAVGDAHDC